MNWTDDFSFYLGPIPDNLLEKQEGPEKWRLSQHIDIHSGSHWPDLDGAHMVILGVDRQITQGNHTRLSGANEIRKQLYSLYTHQPQLKIVDLGNIAPGETASDTDVALQKVVGGLALRDTLVVIIGGSQEITFANFAAYEVLESTVNIAIVDAVIDMGEFRDVLSVDNYLSKIVIHKPSYLFNVSVLGYQTYLNNPETVALMDKLYFDTVRLGEMRRDMRCMEPHLRQADILSIDVNAIKDASAPGTNQPNGLTGEEICQLTRYAGLSDNCSSIGIHNYDPAKDVNRQGAALIAQMIWHVMDGLSGRIKEYPLMNKPDFTEYKVQLAIVQDHISFFKSKRTEKWWMNVPYLAGPDQRPVKHHLIPCNYSDYEIAAKGEIPDLWWRTYRKLT
jgi:arginase family enzyme